MEGAAGVSRPESSQIALTATPALGVAAHVAAPGSRSPPSICRGMALPPQSASRLARSGGGRMPYILASGNLLTDCLLASWAVSDEADADPQTLSAE